MPRIVREIRYTVSGLFFPYPTITRHLAPEASSLDDEDSERADRETSRLVYESRPLPTGSQILLIPKGELKVKPYTKFPFWKIIFNQS
jgi:hypothetical protein